MAPEQLTGHAEPATDIYAAACVALALLTRRPLHLLTDEHHRLHWTEAVSIPPAAHRFLSRMLETSPTRRARDARVLADEARAIIRSPAAPKRRPVRVLLAVALLSAALVSVAAVRAFRPRVDTVNESIPGEAFTEVSPSGASAVLETREGPSPIGTPPVPERTADRARGGRQLWVLRFPDVPASLCRARRVCIPLNDGEIAHQIADACAAAVDIRAGVPQYEFTLKVAGMTSFCQASTLNQCIVSCTLRFKEIDPLTFQERAEDVAQAVRDVHGVEQHSSQWGWEDHLSWGRVQVLARDWRWSDGNFRLDIKAQWHDDPPGSGGPQDIHLDIFRQR
jgi:hypothetical protein